MLLTLPCILWASRHNSSKPLAFCLSCKKKHLHQKVA